MPNEYIDEMSNADYHNPDKGLSTSVIKAFTEDPSSVVWSRNVTPDTTKMPAINFGTDFHAYFLEPELFAQKYRVLPEFNRRKADERSAEKKLIEEWGDEGITPVKTEDMEKLQQMAASALAHPTVSELMSLDGICERSYFWTDLETGIRCKCRPDRLSENLTDNNRPAFVPNHFDSLVVDIKTTDNIDRIADQVEKFKYYIQDPFYTEGVSLVSGASVAFVFVFVSTTMSIGRYPVRVAMLSEEARFDGRTAIRQALKRYSEMQKESDWNTIVTVDRPYWATKEEAIF